MAIKDQCIVCKHFHEEESLCALTNGSPALNSRSCENYSRRSISLDKNVKGSSVIAGSGQETQSVSHRNNNTNLVICPECGKPSDSIKRYTLPAEYWFLYVYMSTQDVIYTCCPHCMRKHILIHGFTYNILTFNVAWPVWILPWMIVQLIRSYSHGHSKEIQELINSGN